MAESALPAGFLLVEANPVHEPALDLCCRRHPTAPFVLAAATSTDGCVAIDDSDPFGGSTRPPGPDALGLAEFPRRSLSSLARDHGLHGPLLVNLDTHERDILAGMHGSLAHTVALIGEIFNPTTSPDCLPAREICREVVKVGFRVFDLVEPRYRPSDETSWGADLVFIQIPATRETVA